MDCFLKLVVQAALIPFLGLSSTLAAQWTGSVNWDWHTAGNWNESQVPTSGDDVIIPSGCPQYPTISSNVAIKSLTIEAGTVSVIDTPLIAVSDAVLIRPGATLSLAGGSLTVDGDFTLDGMFNGGTGTLTLSKKLLNNGTFDAGTGTVVMTGSFQDIDGSPVTFHNLVIQAETFGKVNITVSGDLTVDSGASLTMAANTITVEGALLGDGTVTSEKPFITSLTVIDPTQLDITFSGSVDLTTSENQSNYAIDNGVTVSTATRDVSDNAIVHLVVSTLTNGIEHTLTVSNVEDLVGNAIAGNSNKRFTPQGPLPIQLAYFDASVIANSNNVHVTWQTITETNNYGFYVQQSLDNASSFVDLPNSFVPGQGTTLIPHDYSWTHQSVSPGTYYYRLKQVDLDGTTNYTDAVQVTVDGPTGVDNNIVPRVFTLSQNYPNPFNPTTTIQFTVETSGLTTLTVFNAIGQEIVTLFSGDAEAGHVYTTKFDGTNLANGMYFYKLVSNNQSSIKKLVLLK